MSIMAKHKPSWLAYQLAVSISHKLAPVLDILFLDISFY